ncbi:MAG: restriction endonuclease subunit S, partial [Ruminococcus sp.]|nr:restriction endonuclease subunit S [Ruminococcus sp.]
DAQSTDLPYIADDEKAKKFEASKLQDGDIIIADTAEDEAVGKCVEIGNIGDLSIVSGLHTIPCRPKVKFAPAYLGFYLNSASYHDQLIPLMQGIKVTSISKSAISDTMISAPTNLSEQGKIGQFFTQLDTLITLHQRKLEKLKNVRESMLQKMFPQNGSNKPEIRFKGFTAAWEQRKLSEISECLDSMRIPLNANERSKMQGSIPYYGAGSIQDYINQYLFDEELVLLLEDGDAFDDFKTKSIAQYICGKSWVNNHAHILRPKGDAFFLFISLAHKDIRNVTQLAGASRKKLVKDAMLRIAIDVPSIAEQTKIGAFFKELDGLITLHQRQCDKYKSIKLGLMRKLFPTK